MMPTVPPTPEPDSRSPRRPGLMSRRRFREAAARAAREVAAGVPHAIFVIHVERLRDVAERCGQEAERALFETIQQRLERQLGPWSAECRAGPGEVAILKKECRRRDASRLAHDICAVLDEETFRWRRLTFRLAATVGVLELEERPDGIEDLLACAAEACATAQSFGNDGVLMLTGCPGEREAIERERAWREHLNEVLV